MARKIYLSKKEKDRIAFGALHTNMYPESPSDNQEYFRWVREHHIATLATIYVLAKDQGFSSSESGLYPVVANDLPDDPVGRCGYFCLSTDWIFGMFGKKDPMLPACSLHDSLYDRELNAGITRELADTLFLEAMKALVREGKGTYIQAYIYYGIVRSLGWIVW